MIPRLVIAIGALALLQGAVFLARNIPPMAAPHNWDSGITGMGVYMLTIEQLSPGLFAIVLGAGLEILFRISQAVETGRLGGRTR